MANIIPFPKKPRVQNETIAQVDNALKKLAEVELLRRENADLIKENLRLRKELSALLVTSKY